MTPKLKRLARVSVPLGIAEEIDALEEKDNKLEEKTQQLEADITILSEGQNSLLNEIKQQSGILSQLDKEKLSKSDLEVLKLMLKGDRGEPGLSIKGDKGDTTIVDKIIETVIREKPIVTEVVKEVAVKDTPDAIVEKLETLKDDDRLSATAIKGLEVNPKLSDSIINRAIGIVDQRTSFLINKVSNLSDRVDTLVTTESDPLSWSKTLSQTSLTGNKSGSFDLTTTGVGIFGEVNAPIVVAPTDYALYFYGDLGIDFESNDYIALTANFGGIFLDSVDLTTFGLLKIDNEHRVLLADEGIDYQLPYWTRSGTTLSPVTTGDNILITGTLGAGAITGTSLIKSGGTSSQFLKADGSVDSTAYGNASYSFGANNFSGTGNFTGGNITSDGQIILPEDTPAFTTHDMQRGTVTCKNMNIAQTDLNTTMMVAPDTYWASGYTGSMESFRAKMAFENDSLWVENYLQEPIAPIGGGAAEASYMSFVWKVQLPAGCPDTYYSQLKFLTNSWFSTVGGHPTEALNANLYIYNFNTAAWELFETDDGSYNVPVEMTHTILANVDYYVDANLVAWIMLRNTTANSNDCWWGLDYASIAVKPSKSALDNSYWRGNLTVAGDLTPQGKFSPTDVLPQGDNLYQFGNNSYRWAGITGNVINAYQRLNIGATTYGTSNVTSAPIYIHLSNNATYTGGFIDLTNEEYDPRSLHSDADWYSNFYYYVDHINYANIDINNHIWNQHEFYRGFTAQSTTLFFSEIHNDILTKWLPSLATYVPTPSDSKHNYFIQNNHHATFTGGETITAPTAWYGSVYRTASVTGFSSVDSWGWVSQPNCGFGGNAKLYFDLDNVYELMTGDTYLSYVTANSDLELYVDNTQVMVWDNDLIEVKIPITLGSASTDNITCIGRLKPRTTTSDPQHVTAGSRPAGTVGEMVYYNGKWYGCTNSTTPTWEKFTSL